MSQTPSWLNSTSPYLRKIDENERIYPSGKHVELVFIIKAANFLLLRTEGPGDINEATLPESKIAVPVIQPQKLMAVVRRRMLQALRDYKKSGADLGKFISSASELGFQKARDIVNEVQEKVKKKEIDEKKSNEYLTKMWNCTIQPPIAGGGEMATDIGMDGFCPACTIFGAALTKVQLEGIENMSIGIKTRVHFDPTFSTSRMVVPETHNKVSEGHLATTGGALFSDVHVMPGTIFVGRATLHDLTEPELLAVLYSLAATEEIGGRSGVYGTIKVELLGIRGGSYSTTTSLELADEIVKQGLEKPSDIVNALKDKLRKLEFTEISNNEVLSRVDPTKVDNNAVFTQLWESNIKFVEQMVNWINELKGETKRRGRRSSE